jgi:ATPase family AAA domain-containing protein 2
VEGMLSQMDPTLVSFCDKIAEQGGPLHFEGNDDAGSILQSNPVAQLAVVTRASARLRNVQPEVNLSQSYEVLKRQKKSTENDHSGIQFFLFLNYFKAQEQCCTEQFVLLWDMILLIVRN